MCVEIFRVRAPTFPTPALILRLSSWPSSQSLRSRPNSPLRNCRADRSSRNSRINGFPSDRGSARFLASLRLCGLQGGGIGSSCWNHHSPPILIADDTPLLIRPFLNTSVHGTENDALALRVTPSR